AGKYRITPMRWPEYVNKVAGCTSASVNVSSDNEGVGSAWTTEPTQRVGSTTMDLAAGPAELEAILTREDGKTFGAYYVKVEYLGEEEESP
ncbi:MAG: hypothetical protein AB8C95_14900, partial [Phycisphaeraceae bacterium]